MMKLLELLSHWLVAYGKAAGHSPSFRGSYEPPVPKCIQEGIHYICKQPVLWLLPLSLGML